MDRTSNTQRTTTIIYFRGRCPLCQEHAFSILGDRGYTCLGGCGSEAIEREVFRRTPLWHTAEVVADVEEARP